MKPRQELFDVVMWAYLTLVCRFQNCTNPSDSPRYHTWLPQLWQNTDAATWPPQGYQDARLEDVSVHLFPICIGDRTVPHPRERHHLKIGHWVIVALYKEQGVWTASLYSSLSGYETRVLEPGKVIAHWLHRITEGSLDVRQVEPSWDPSQPLQNNGTDCGVFALAGVRWAAESWDRASIAPENIEAIRLRMTVEFRAWDLTIQA